MATLSAADVNATIAAMGNDRRQEASDTAAELEKRWAKTAPTLTPVQLASLRALEGDNPMRLQMRWDLIQSVRARGADPRTVGGV
jgi:hypothetical protein